MDNKDSKDSKDDKSYWCISTKNIWCVSVDGSKFSQYGWEVTLEELYKQGDEIYVVHISNEEKTDVPYECQSLTLLNKYEVICKGIYPPLNYGLIFQPKTQKNVHAMEDIYKIAKSKNATCLVMGFEGHKANILKKELTKGIIYMINNITMPVLIIKERSIRKKKDTKGFNWLISLNSSKYSRTYFNSFNTALSQVDMENDKVMGITLTRPGDGSDKKEVEEDFYNRCKQNNVKNCSFTYELYDKKTDDIGRQIANFVNFSQERIDFVCLGFNKSKFTNIEDAPAINVIKFAMANVLYCPNPNTR